MSFLIRPTVAADLPSLGLLAAALVRMHYEFDPARFLPADEIAPGYERFLRSVHGRPNVVLLTAEDQGRVVGYAYGSVEPRDWNALLDTHGLFNDLFVDPCARRKGIARALARAMVAELESRGAPRVVLHTAVQNEPARKLFETLGFRATTIEMMRTSTG